MTRTNFLRNKFGLSLEQYDNLLIKQNFSCRICGTHISKLTRQLAVDHCHKTNKIRSLLCTNCNVSIGLLKEDTQILQNMIDYLKEHQNETKK